MFNLEWRRLWTGVYNSGYISDLGLCQSRRSLLYSSTYPTIKKQVQKKFLLVIAVHDIA